MPSPPSAPPSSPIRATYAVNAYADFLLDQDRPAEVAALVGNDRRNDGKLLRLALAAQVVGDTA